MSIWSWLIGAFGGCRHEWEEYRSGATGNLYRGCKLCHQVEKFEPDCGGNTAGHWDRVT